MQRPIYLVLSLFMLVTILLTGCGGQETVAPPQTEPTAAPQTSGNNAEPTEEVVMQEPVDDTTVALPMVDPLAVTGDIISAGSSTVFPLAERMATRFEAEGYSGKITIDSIGSGGGFERFCVTGETDVANASRPIKSSEVESCTAIGRTPIEFRVGTDALAVVVSQENTFIENASLEELALIFSTAETWAAYGPLRELLEPLRPALDLALVYDDGEALALLPYRLELK